VTEAIHRSNRERTSATRTRLLDAALAALVDVGYAKASTVEICRRADAPRGTLLHHFPTRSSLMCAAISYVWERRLLELRRAVEVPEPPTDGNGNGSSNGSGNGGGNGSGNGGSPKAVDLLWQMYSGPTYDAWMELVVAARTDAELRSELRSVWRRFDTRLQSTLAELFPGSSQLTVAALSGLSLDRIFRSPEDLAPLVDSLKQL
jgi:AcrR family transcriptional regulator